jgi:hypothetical protein
MESGIFLFAGPSAGAHSLKPHDMCFPGFLTTENHPVSLCAASKMVYVIQVLRSSKKAILLSPSISTWKFQSRSALEFGQTQAVVFAGYPRMICGSFLPYHLIVTVMVFSQGSPIRICSLLSTHLGCSITPPAGPKPDVPSTVAHFSFLCPHSPSVIMHS